MVEHVMCLLAVGWSVWLVVTGNWHAGVLILLLAGQFRIMGLLRHPLSKKWEGPVPQKTPATPVCEGCTNLKRRSAPQVSGVMYRFAIHQCMECGRHDRPDHFTPEKEGASG